MGYYCVSAREWGKKMVPKSFGEFVVLACIFLLVGSVSAVLVTLLGWVFYYLFQPGVLIGVFLLGAFIYALGTLVKRVAS